MTRDYVVEHIVKKFNDDEFSIDPEYQRNFVWNEEDKCFFIESLLMWLPIPGYASFDFHLFEI